MHASILKKLRDGVLVLSIFAIAIRLPSLAEGNDLKTQSTNQAKEDVETLFTAAVNAAKRGNDKEAFTMFKKAAEQGHPDAQFKLAEYLMDGLGTSQSKSEADVWYAKARTNFLQRTKTNDVKSMCQLGRMYFLGKGMTQNKTEAYKWLEMAAANGDEEATNLRNLLVKSMTKQEFEILKKSTAEFLQVNRLERLKKLHLESENGNTSAQVQYATELLADGEYSKAVAHLKAAAENGNADGQIRLGCAYYKGQGASKSYLEAARWFQKAAEQNHPYAQLLIAHCYITGKGVEQDMNQAERWLRASAKGNSAIAQYILGEFFYTGVLPENHLEAVKWFRLSAEQGHVLAQFSLGQCYQWGRGVPQDYKQAAFLFGNAAKQGDYDAQRELAVLYAKGLGVSADNAEATKWLVLASAQNDTKATEYLRVAAEISDPSIVEQGRQRAHTFTPKKTSATKAYEEFKIFWKNN